MTMRLTDMLQTETPRPCLDDRVFTGFDTMFPDPVVIDATDVGTLFMEMTLDDPGKTREQMMEIRRFEKAMGEGRGWQVASFFQFDFTTIGCVAPPYECFVMEFDTRASMEQAAKALGRGKFDPRETVDVGRQCIAFYTFSREQWLDDISPGLSDSKGFRILAGEHLAEMERLPYHWVYAALTFRTQPGEGLVGPLSTWLIPIDAEGKIFIDRDHHGDNPNLMFAASLGPRCRDDEQLSNEYAISQGWTVVVPALLALTFMHTPRTDAKREGYHALIDQETTGKVARKYLERNFRPLVRWHTLDIGPLREAVRHAHGGQMPTDFQGFKKALHSVRGYTRTYMPNTYFGRKHDRPITVFTPAHRRGDARSGVVKKEYRLNAGGAPGEVTT